MNSHQRLFARRPRFSIRAVLGLTLLVGLILGWRSSLQRAERRLAEQKQQLALQENRLRYAAEELNRARDDIADLARPKRDATRPFWQSEFDGDELTGVTIASASNVFQRASFRGCNLERAMLQGGTSSFQLARFDRSKLAGAKLVGGNAAFQGATFVGADLSGAVLSGSASSFQRASFEQATLVRARLAGSFQAVNISGANFARADLSALNRDDLASCYFQEPPRYDGQTKFPAGFDPQAQLWRCIDEQPSGDALPVDDP